MDTCGDCSEPSAAQSGTLLLTRTCSHWHSVTGHSSTITVIPSHSVPTTPPPHTCITQHPAGHMHVFTLTVKWAPATRVTDTHTYSDTPLWSPQPHTVTRTTLTPRHSPRVYVCPCTVTRKHTTLTINIHPQHLPVQHTEIPTLLEELTLTHARTCTHAAPQHSFARHAIFYMWEEGQLQTSVGPHVPSSRKKCCHSSTVQPGL